MDERASAPMTSVLAVNIRFDLQKVLIMLKTILLAMTMLALSACVVKPVGYGDGHRGNGCGPDAHRDQQGDCKRDRR